MNAAPPNTPTIMVAPNGARRGKQHHPALPVSIDETIATAAACHQAGAHALHAHVRDAHGAHTLDAGVYRELLDEMQTQVPSMAVQITTESAGKYTAADQRRLLHDLRPPWASVALAEMLSDGVPDDNAAATRLYHWAAAEGIRIQHILYTPQQTQQLAQLVRRGNIPTAGLSLLFVLGRYHPPQNGTPDMLAPFLQARKALPCPSDFMVCAFGCESGSAETSCLLGAATAGGNCRVGFENNLHHPNGELAADNAARVAEVVAALSACKYPVMGL